TMHNVKGASQLTGLDKISRLSHRLEDLLDLLREGQMQATPETVLLLIAGRDRIVTLISELEESQQELSTVDEFIGQLSTLINGGEAEVTEQAESASATTQEPISVEAESTSSNEYNEENDSELFNIYLEHLKEQFSLLSTASSYLKQVSVDVEHLLECKDAVSRLKSSANYMGYDDIVNSFNAWNVIFDNAHQSISRGETISLDFIDDIADDLISAFPQLENIWGSDVGRIPSGSTEPVEEVDEITESATEGEDDISLAVLNAFKDHEIEAEPGEINLAMVDDFIDESRESLDEMESLLLALVPGAENENALAGIFRVMHNIKVSSQLAKLEKTSILAHRLEDLLSLLRAGELVANEQIVELLISGRDRILGLITDIEVWHQEKSPIDDLVEQLITLIDSSSSRISSASTSDSQSKNTDLLSSSLTSSEETIEQAAAELKKSSAITISMSSFEEDHDQELFDIFISHLQEQLSYIQSFVVQMETTSSQVELLEQCINAINCLHSSSNYMGYEELTKFYKNWKAALEDAIQTKSDGEVMSLDFMSDYVEALARAFPQIDSHKTSALMPTTSIDKVISKTPVVHERVDAPSTNPETSDSNESQEKTLFNRLNNALKSSLNKMSSSEEGTLNEVFDELMSPKESKGTEVASKSAAVKKSVLNQQQKTEQAQDVRRKSTDGGEKKLKKSVRVDAEKIDALMNQVGELVVDRSYFFQLFNEMRELQQYLKETSGLEQKDVKMVRTFTYRLGEAISALGRTSNELQEGVMKMRMLPVAHLFNRYPRLVHDLTSRIDKKVELILRGEDTELDKMIVEELSDPLIDIIRNAIDHGIETAEERAKTNKPATGKLVLEAYQESNHIVIEVTDDGRGLNPEKIKQKAISKELYTRDELERFTEREISNLILMPGFSTAETITDTSGRGVGMDVVKRNI
ncbi:MAG: Hpt domain-containing protein, partial [Gammaproteobacteria bacterium]|nr:Hpt domain-containing protein [Gammaproteobacteria bacterium]